MPHDTTVTDVQTVSCNLRIFVTRVDKQPTSLTSEHFVHTTVDAVHIPHWLIMRVSCHV